MAGVSIKNLTRRPTAPRAAFSVIAKEVLPSWEISLVFVSSAKALALNKQLRKKNYVPNVLSYALGPKSGEVIICPQEAGKQAPAYGMSSRTFILYLFIHALLHVKGWVHSGTMEKCEQKLLARFAKDTTHPLLHETHRNRNRHRHVPGKDGRGRRVR